MKITTDAIVPNPRWRWWAFWRPRYVAGQLSCTITEKGSGPVQPYAWRDLPPGADAAPDPLNAMTCRHVWQDVTAVENYHEFRKMVCSVCGKTVKLPTSLYPGETTAIRHPAGHQWAADPHDGTVDFFALDFDDPEGFSGHNGPRCIRCGFTYCVHCHQDGPPRPCKDATPPTG